MMDWQRIVREATKEAASAKWRDYALARLPDVPGWNLSKPKGFGGGSEATYAGHTKGGIPLKVIVDKGKGVWRAEAGGLVVEDDIAGLDTDAVQHALGEAAEAMDQHIEETRRGPKVASLDFANSDVRKLSGSLYDIRQRADAALGSLDAMLGDEGGRNVTLDEVRQAVGYHLDMIEQATGAFRHR